VRGLKRSKMLFKLEHKQMILDGKKTATRRIWKRPMVKVDGIYKCKLKMLSKDYFAKIKITKLYKQKLGDMKQSDFKKEGYPNSNDFITIWAKINKTWDYGLEVDVIEFTLINTNKSEKLV